MDYDVFDVFDHTPYTFLELGRGGVTGNTILSQTDADGVFKLREGRVLGDTTENAEQGSTIHIHSTESFTTPLNGNLVGHAVRVYGTDYEIIGQTGGKNFHNGVMEHYRCTLVKTDLSDWSES